MRLFSEHTLGTLRHLQRVNMPSLAYFQTQTATRGDGGQFTYSWTSSTPPVKCRFTLTELNDSMHLADTERSEHHLYLVTVPEDTTVTVGQRVILEHTDPRTLETVTVTVEVTSVEPADTYNNVACRFRAKLVLSK